MSQFDRTTIIGLVIILGGFAVLAFTTLAGLALLTAASCV